MKRKASAVLCLLLVALTLTGCQGQQNQTVYTEVTQYLGPATATPEPTSVPVNSDVQGVSDSSVFNANPYDDDPLASAALGEEDYADTGVYVGDGDNSGVYAGDAVATAYPYAGSSPIPLDPIDAPTPTPRPSLTFTYVPYTALGLGFEAPAGWIPDESVSDVYTLSEPAEQMKDNQLGIVTIYAVPVNSNYTESNLKAEVLQRLDTIGATDYASWKPSLTASRYLMGGKGVYANYSGTLANGTEVGGRIHCTCIDKVLYCVQITYPLGFKDDYLNIFAKVRETIKRQQ